MDFGLRRSKSAKPTWMAGPGMTAERLAPSKPNATPAEWRTANGVTRSGKFVAEFARGSQTYAGTGTLCCAW